MPLSESAIESAIDSLKSAPGKFQRLVEFYAQFTYPDRFKNLVPAGRNPNDVTVRGWPDVYSYSTDGRLDVVEATHSPKWPEHLQEDIEKAEALGSGRLVGFLFVAWDNEPSPLTDHKKVNPRYEKLSNCRDRLIALDIPSDNINFVFKKQLVRALTQPRFAYILKEISRLPCHSLPFRLISQVTHVFGKTGRIDVFAPTKDEYRTGMVHRAAITDEVEKRLACQGWAWIRGRGAAGKTVLSVQVALGYEVDSHPAYYLDLAETNVDASDALDMITALADEHVLFILDNVHLDEDFANDVFNQWRLSSMGSRLLMVGRDVSISYTRGTAQPLDEIRDTALTLEVTPPDLMGVFLRLARRYLSNPDYYVTPPHEALQNWYRLFGGDLIAFSAAVAQRIAQLTQGDWEIQAKDASNYVRETYLDKVNEIERLNLLRIAVLAQLEVDTINEVLELSNVNAFLRSGLLHSIRRGRDGSYNFYKLVHPGLGDLLLTAANYSGKQLNQFILEQLLYVACHSPFWGMQISVRLEAANRKQEAILVLRSIAQSDEGLALSFETTLRHLRANCERLIRFNVLLQEDIDKKLSGKCLALCQSALRTPLGDLASFLQYAENKLPKVYTAMAAALSNPSNLKILSERVLRTPLGDLASFLQYAENKLPKVYTAMAAALSNPSNLKILSERALLAPLDHLASFLQYAETKLPKVYTAMAAALSNPSNLKTLSERALLAPLGDLASFLQYAETKLPKVYTALAAALSNPSNLKTLSETALLTPLGDLASFLQYAETKLPKVYTALAAALSNPSNLKTLSETALLTPLSDLASFLQYAENKLPTVYTAITTALGDPANLTTLSENALRTPLHFLASFLQYAENKLPKVYTAMAAALSNPSNLKILSERALLAPLDHLASFLQYAETKLPKVYTALAAALSNPSNLKILSERALLAPLDHLASFLQYAETKLPIAPAIVSVINRDEWDRVRKGSKSGWPYYLPTVAGVFRRLGRPELAEAPAQALISVAEPQHWHASGIGLPHISHVMRLGHGAGREAVLRFLDRVVTADWLKMNYEKAHSHTIAACLFALWGYHEPSILNHFCDEALKLRVTAEMRYLDVLTSEKFSAALQLLGCASLIGVKVKATEVAWPNDSRVCDTLRFAAPNNKVVTIGHIQIQLWVGLREMARMRPDRITIPPESGVQILARWKNSVGYTVKQNLLNTLMIDWLDRCAQAGWVLISDKTLLAEEIISTEAELSNAKNL